MKTLIQCSRSLLLSLILGWSHSCRNNSNIDPSALSDELDKVVDDCGNQLFTFCSLVLKFCWSPEPKKMRIASGSNTLSAWLRLFGGGTAALGAPGATSTAAALAAVISFWTFDLTMVSQIDTPTKSGTSGSLAAYQSCRSLHLIPFWNYLESHYTLQQMTSEKMISIVVLRSW